MDFVIKHNGEDTKASVHHNSHGIHIHHQERMIPVTFAFAIEHLRNVDIEGQTLEVGWYRSEDGIYHIEVAGEHHCVELSDYHAEHFRKLQPKESRRAENYVLKAPIPGRIVRVDVAVGQQVEKGQCLLVLSAMKLENVLSAPHAGKVRSISVKPDDLVAKNQLLLELE